MSTRTRWWWVRHAPVTSTDGRIYGNGRPGPLTTRIRDLYWSKHEAGWHATPVDYDSP